MNPLYEQLNNNNFLYQFKKFRESFTGNPQQEVQNLLNSGKISQQQYNNAVNMANQLQSLIGTNRL